MMIYAVYAGYTSENPVARFQGLPC